MIAVDPVLADHGRCASGGSCPHAAYADDRNVFIRSMASRGHAGIGIHLERRAAVLDACGFDLLLIETVGTGQSEVEVAAAADTTVVLEAPEMGDEASRRSKRGCSRSPISSS